MVDPDAYLVPGYPAGIMPHQADPPVSLTDDEVVAVAAYITGLRSPEDLAAARAEIPRARDTAAELVREKELEQLPWSIAHPDEGAQPFQELCGKCHTKEDLAAKHLAREEVARWMIVPPKKEHDFSGELPGDIVNICTHVAGK